MNISGEPENNGSVKTKEKKRTFDFSWAWRVFLLSFAISIVLSMASEGAAEGMNLFVSFLVLVVFIILGILFDVIGLSIATADATRFNAMAAKHIKGARAALWFISKSAVMSNFCNDVIGDISGVLCGTMSSVIALNMAETFDFNTLIATAVTTAFTSALIVGGKALFKGFAIKKSNEIVFFFSKIICLVIPENKFMKRKK